MSIQRKLRDNKLRREILTVFGVQYQILWVQGSKKSADYVCMQNGEWVRRVDLVMPYPANGFYPAPSMSKQREIAAALEKAAQERFSDGFKVAPDVISWD